VDALRCNDTFSGPVSLKNNSLTDLACLNIAEVLRKPHANITKLDLSKNNQFTLKAGEYIG